MKDQQLGDISHPGIPNQSDIVTAGMIMSETDCKMNEKSVLLLSSKAVGSGSIVSTNLSELSEYSIFPGQVVAMEASNPNGYLLTAKKLLSEMPLEYALSASSKLMEYHHDSGKLNGKPLNVITSSGPYTFDDSLDYQLLEDLLKTAESSNCDVLILVIEFI